MNKAKKPFVLVVLDGWGYREDATHNAIAQAKTPNFDKLWQEYPHTTLEASGLAVGLPEGQMGNSEIGHMTIGAGAVIDTDLVRINKTIRDTSLADHPVFQKLLEHVAKHDSKLHVMGLLGPGGVHAHDEHLYAAVKAAPGKVVVHAFADGRDTPPQSAADYLEQLEAKLEEFNNGMIGSISGRYYAMDRDHNWDRLAQTEKAIFEGEGEGVQDLKPSEHLRKLYQDNNQFDEHLMPTIFPSAEGEIAKIEENDAVFIFNFRSDRARMITAKLMEQKPKLNLAVGTMTHYGEMCNDCHVIFPPNEIQTTLADEISKAGLRQAHIAETEKFAHATYFLNGGKERVIKGERDILLDSRKDVATHDSAPKMRAEAITDKALEEIAASTDFIFINYANADMIGHTANVPAIIEGLEEVDQQLGRLSQAIIDKGGVMLVTADHGNAEINVDLETGKGHTAHTTNPVPAILTQTDVALRDGGGLADIAPTILTLLNLPVPEVMTGKNLLTNNR